jgi:hypothetical protein
VTQVWATMATIPERAGARAMAVESLLPQVDRLIITFGHEKGDQVKFDCCAEARDVFILGVDDDLVYPPDYVERTIAGLQDYGFGAVVGYHGFTINQDGGREDTYRVLGDVEERVQVDVIGTGVVGFHSDALNLTPADFPTRNAAMFWVALKAARLGLPLVILPHQERWFPAYVEHQRTMWSETFEATGSHFDYSNTMQEPLRELIALKDWPVEEPDEQLEEAVA